MSNLLKVQMVSTAKRAIPPVRPVKWRQLVNSRYNDDQIVFTAITLIYNDHIMEQLHKFRLMVSMRDILPG